MQRNSPIRNWCLSGVCVLLCLAVQGGATETTPSKKFAKSSTASSATSSTHKGKRSRTKKKAGSSKKRGQKAIESERAQQIQEALIREHYMDGEPSGKWDDRTQAALRRYQADQGWQSKTVPDSRALIKLGLGPNHDRLLNPESAMTTVPAKVDPKAKPKSRSADATPLPAVATPPTGNAPPQ